MRATLPLAAVLLGALMLLPGLAVGQQSDERLFSVEAAPFSAPVKPLAGIGTTNLTVRVACALLAAAGTQPGAGAQIRLEVLEAPAWAVLTVSPSTLNMAFDPQGCSEGAMAKGKAMLVASMTADAPAFSPAPVTILAHLDNAAGGYQDTAEVDAVAGFMSVIDARVEEPIQRVQAGEQAVYRITLTNFGNGRTRVAFEVAEAPPQGWTVGVPAPLTLDAKQEGGTMTSSQAIVRIATPQGADRATVRTTLTYATHYADDETQKGDSGTVALLTSVESSGFFARPAGEGSGSTSGEAPAKSPGAGAGLVLALSVTAALARRGPRRDA